MAYGKKKRTRADHNARLSRPNFALMLSSLGLCAWAIVFPHPRAVVVMLLLVVPLLAMLLYRTEPLARADGAKITWRQMNLLTPLILCAVAILWLGTQEPLIDRMPAMPAAVVAGCVLAWAGGMPNTPAWRIKGALIMSAYAFGVICVSNSLFDERRPAAYLARIERTSHGSGKALYYALDVRPALSGVSGGLYVSRPFYQRVGRGDTVCVLTHPGALGLPWYEVAPADRCAAPSLPQPAAPPGNA